MAKKILLCVNLYCEECGNDYEDYPSRRSALKQRKIECQNCDKMAYHWSEFYRMEE